MEFKGQLLSNSYDKEQQEISADITGVKAAIPQFESTVNILLGIQQQLQSVTNTYISTYEGGSKMNYKHAVEVLDYRQKQIQNTIQRLSETLDEYADKVNIINAIADNFGGGNR